MNISETEYKQILKCLRAQEFTNVCDFDNSIMLIKELLKLALAETNNEHISKSLNEMNKLDLPNIWFT
jgi:hypothetical protein